MKLAEKNRCFGEVLWVFVDEFWHRQYVISLEFLGFGKSETDMKRHVLVSYEILKNAENVCSFPNHYFELSNKMLLSNMN